MPAASATPREVLWEVLRPSCPVRAEPHLDAKVLGSKRRGQKVACNEITMDGWLKLADEVGWMISDMQGIQGLGAMLQPTQGEDVDVSIDEPQPQGICCLEITFNQAAVRAFPSRDAVALYYRRKGELIFARSQSFDGWLRLAGEDGWMLSSTEEHGVLLEPRVSKADAYVDLWALSDIWASVRRKRRILGVNEVKALKEVEEGTLLMADMDFEHHVKADNVAPLVEDGLLTRLDLTRPEAWVRQRLFANTLCRTAKEEPPLADLVQKDFKLTPRPLPMDLFADSSDLAETKTDDSSRHASSSSRPSQSGRGASRGGGSHRNKPNFFGGGNGGYGGGLGGFGNLMGEYAANGSRGGHHRATGSGRGGFGRGMGGMPGGDASGMQLMVIDGENFLMTEEGLIMEPETCQPLGMFNPETGQIEELTDEQLEALGLGDMDMIELNGRPYMIFNGMLIDAKTQEITYRLEPDGTVIDIMTGQSCGTIEPEQDPVNLQSSSDPFQSSQSGTNGGGCGGGGLSGYGPSFDDEPLDANGWAERAKELLEDDYYYQAASAFGEALQCCEKERAVELEFECQLLRGRASCWRAMREFQNLLEDSEKLLKYDGSDVEAKEWKALAIAELGTGRGKRR